MLDSLRASRKPAAVTTTDLRSPPGRSSTRALRSFLALTVAGLPLSAAGGLALSGGHGAGMVLSSILFMAMAGLTFRALARGFPHDRLGLCNAITLFRAALTAAVAGPLAVPGLLAADQRLAWIVLAVATLSLSLDGVDGWLARRSRLVSDFGARFDMEVDSVLALVLACLALVHDKAGVWVLALGAMRYAYLAAALVWPWLGGALPQRFRRKLICVVQIAVLIALLAPVLTPPFSTFLALAATLLLAWSFAVDILWLARRK